MTRAPRNPLCMDLVTSCMKQGVRLFERVAIADSGRLYCSMPIAAFDFVAVVPVHAVVSVTALTTDASWPTTLRVSSQNVNDSLKWWPEADWGTLAMSARMAKVLLTKRPAGEFAHYSLLPVPEYIPGPLADVIGATSHPMFQRLTSPLRGQLGVSEEDFVRAFVHAFVLYRLHAKGLWAGGSGHPAIGEGAFVAQNPLCTLLGMIPIMDLASHSPRPNSSIGMADADMMQWLHQERGVPHSLPCFVLQAVSDIREGDVISVNRNDTSGYSSALFKSLFGYPLSRPEPNADDPRALWPSQNEGEAVEERGEVD